MNDYDDNLNKNLFLLFKISNFALCIIGLIMIIISIYLINLTSISIFLYFYLIIIGIILFVLSFYGFKLRFSPQGNYIFNIILSGVFICFFILTISVFINKDSVINLVVENNKAGSNSNFIKMISNNLDRAYAFLLVDLVIFVKLIINQLSIIIISWIYRKSLITRQDNQMPLNPDEP